MALKVPFFYGWIIIGIAWVCYGFGISPGYYSWGIFKPEISAELGLSGKETGLIFGIFVLLYSCVGPAVGWAQAKIGIRWTMVSGFTATAIGMFLMSKADSLLHCIVSFSIIAGAGIGFATIVPCQTLGQNWFLKRRAIAIALIFTSGGIVGKIVARADSFILENYTWRTGWEVIAVTSAILAVIAALLVRDRPEDMDMFRDGASSDDDAAGMTLGAKDSWTAAQAIRTKQFRMMVLCGCAYAVPWGIVVPNLREHLEIMGFETSVAIAFVGTMAFMSIFGRLAGAIGDYLDPRHVLAVSLVLEALGCFGLLYANTTAIVYFCITAIALGFGTAYISVPVVFNQFFGRNAFGMTSGIRIFITGIFNGSGPIVAGAIFDQTGTYTIALYSISALAAIGAITAFALRDPGVPDQAEAA